MPQIVQIQLANWFQAYKAKVQDLELKVNDQVIFKTEAGIDIGRITGILEVSEQNLAKMEESLSPILRKVTTEDLNIAAEHERQRLEAIDFCRKTVDRLNLSMKIIGIHFSFDGGRLIFPFIADGRIDFRDLVKDLTHYFQKSIRLQQIGIRDEAKISGDFGSCGRHLCCKNFVNLKELGSVTSELADLQQVSHRGSERLTGLCGRLRCCLAFEKEIYEKEAAKLPPLGSKITTPKGRGEVVGLNILKQSVNVALGGDRGNIIEVPIHPGNNKL